MANLFVDLPLPALNGPGAAVDTSGMGSPKTIEVVGDFLEATITVEASNDGGASFESVLAFQTPGGQQVVDLAAQFMRVNVRGRQLAMPFAANCDVGANDIGSLFAVIPVPLVDGPGLAVNVSAFGVFTTVIVGGAFPGARILVEISEDGVDWAPLVQFSDRGGIWSGPITAAFVRANVSGRRPGPPFTPTLSLGSVNDPVGIAGVDVSVEGVPIGPGPFTELDFIGPGILAADAGGGTAAIMVTGAGTVRFVGSTAIVATDDYLLVDTTAPRVITLPNPAATPTKAFTIKDISGQSETNEITLTPFGPDFIEGLPAARELRNNFGIWRVLNDGADWWLV